MDLNALVILVNKVLESGGFPSILRALESPIVPVALIVPDDGDDGLVLICIGSFCIGR